MRVAMAMPKKGSRSLVVDEQKYRWRIRGRVNWTKRNQYGAEATLIIFVETYENPASVLVIRNPCSMDYNTMACCGRWRERSTGEEIRVTPRQVADLIRKALEQGWNPQAREIKNVLVLKQSS